MNKTSAIDHRPDTRGKQTDDGDIDLLALLNALWRGKIVIGLCAALGLAAGWYEATKVAVPLYTATTQMALQIRNEPLVDIESVISGVSGDEYSMNTEMEIIRSRELISRLVDELDLVNDPEFNPMLGEARPVSLTRLPRMALGWTRRQAAGLIFGSDAPEDAAPFDPDAPLTDEENAELYRGIVSDVRGSVDAELGEWSYVFTISATTESREKSALIANTLAQIYRDDQIRQKVEATENAAVWLSTRISELGEELQLRQEEAALLRAQTGLVSDEALAALNEQAIELGQSLQRAQSEAAMAARRSEAIGLAPEGDAAAIAMAADDAQLQAIATAIAREEPGAQARFDRRLDQVTLQIEAEAERSATLVTTIEAQLADLRAEFETQS